jgi:hypothetical protein
MGFEDPSSNFKTLYNALERYQMIPDLRKYDLEIDEQPRGGITNKRSSLTGGGILNIYSQASDNKAKE